MAKKTGKSLGEIRLAHRKRLLAYRRKIARTVAKLKAGDEEKLQLLALLGVGGRSERLLWSDAYAAYIASRRFAGLMQAYRAANPGKLFWLVTFKDDCGNTSDRSPYVQLKMLEYKIRRAMATLKVEGIVVLEVHPLMNYPGGGAGRMLLFHGHAIIWTDEPFNEKLAMSQLNESRAWSNSLIGDPIDIRPIEDAREHMERVALYMWKRPHSAKNRMSDKKHPGQFILMDTTAGYRDEFALRVFEGLTQVDLMDTVFGVGHGRTVRQDLTSYMRTWHRSRAQLATVVPAAMDVWAMWLGLRQRVGSKLFAPYRFDRMPAQKRTPRPSAPKPPKRRRPKIKRPSAMVLKRRQRRQRSKLNN